MEANRNINNYWPDVIKQIVDFEEIAIAENPEFTNILSEVNKFIDNNFILNADSNSTARREKMFDIKTDTTLSLSDRRIMVLTEFANRPPFTDTWLKQKLNEICGSENYDLTFINTDFKITIVLSNLDIKIYNRVKTYLEGIVPANLILTISYCLRSKFSIHENLYKANMYQMKLGTWKLGRTPFRYTSDEVMLK